MCRNNQTRFGNSVRRASTCGCGCGQSSPSAAVSLGDYQPYILVPTTVFEEDNGCDCGCDRDCGCDCGCDSDCGCGCRSCF